MLHINWSVTKFIALENQKMDIIILTKKLSKRVYIANIHLKDILYYLCLSQCINCINWKNKKKKYFEGHKIRQQKFTKTQGKKGNDIKYVYLLRLNVFCYYLKFLLHPKNRWNKRLMQHWRCKNSFEKAYTNIVSIFVMVGGGGLFLLFSFPFLFFFPNS